MDSAFNVHGCLPVPSPVDSFFWSIPVVLELVLAVDFASVGPFGRDASVEAVAVEDVAVVVVALVASSSSSVAGAGAAEEAVEGEASAALLGAVLMVPVSCGSPALDLWPSSWCCRWV